MRTKLYLLLLAALPLAGAAMPVKAQDVYGGAQPPVARDGYYDDDSYDDARGPVRAYGPRSYGYLRLEDDDDDEVVMYLGDRSGGCGTYRYWNGRYCADARIR